MPDVPDVADDPVAGGRADPAGDPAGGPAGGPRAGRLALVGSGEYLPVMQRIEGELLAAGPGPRYVQIATAAAPEGADSLARWRRLGAEQGARLGVEVVSLPVVDRMSADDPDLAALVAGAGLVYLSGGNPGYLSETLRGTRAWSAVVAAWRTGTSLAGCSAGAMAMTSWVPNVRRLAGHPVDGLGLLPHLRVIPHFDRMLGWMPDVVTRYLLHAPDGVTVLGIDEDTALVGGPVDWVVRGRRRVWVLDRSGRQGYADGAALHTATGAFPPAADG